MRFWWALIGASICVSVLGACSDDRDGALHYIDAAIDAEVDAAVPDMARPDAASSDMAGSDGTSGDESDGGDAGDET